VAVVTDNTRAEHDATKAQDNPLWIYAVKQYQHADCARFLLQAQDEMGLEVNILLLCGWLATRHQGLNLQAVTGSDAYHWQQDIIKPLREIRRRAKSYQQDEFYRDVLALELSAEKQQLRALYELKDKMPKGQENFAQNVRLSCEEYFKGKNTILQESWLQTLIKHLQPNRLG